MEASADEVIQVCEESASRMTSGISHVAVRCSDIRKSLIFYRDHLGFAEHCRLNYASTTNLMLISLKVSDEQWIELFDGRNVKRGEKVLHQVALQVPNAEAVRARCSRNGLAVPERVWQGQMRNLGFTTLDPNGVTIEFVQSTEQSWMRRDHGRFLADRRVSSRIRSVNIASDASDDQNRLFFGKILGLRECTPDSLDGRPQGVEKESPLGFRDGPDEITITPPFSTEGRLSFTLEVEDVDFAVNLMRGSGYGGEFIKAAHADRPPRSVSCLDPDGLEVVLKERGGR